MFGNSNQTRGTNFRPHLGNARTTSRVRTADTSASRNGTEREAESHTAGTQGNRRGCQTSRCAGGGCRCGLGSSQSWCFIGGGGVVRAFEAARGADKLLHGQGHVAAVAAPLDDVGGAQQCFGAAWQLEATDVAVG